MIEMTAWNGAAPILVLAGLLSLYPQGSLAAEAWPRPIAPSPEWVIPLDRTGLVPGQRERLRWARVLTGLGLVCLPAESPPGWRGPYVQVRHVEESAEIALWYYGPEDRCFCLKTLSGPDGLEEGETRVKEWRDPPELVLGFAPVLVRSDFDESESLLLRMAFLDPEAGPGDAREIFVRVTLTPEVARPVLESLRLVRP